MGDRVGAVHTMDRLMATTLSTAFFSRVVLMLNVELYELPGRSQEPSLGPEVFTPATVHALIAVLGIAAAALAFIMKRRASLMCDLSQYMVWTTVWHLVLPFTGLLWIVCLLQLY